jgi:aryl-alcohol dehydrogenase-like predicted oxidoreductase
MEKRQFGNTDLWITPLGIGLAEIGFQLESSQADEAGKVLNAALDSGINFLDTAGCYGVSEELVGRTVSSRRDEFVLASKTGHMNGECGEDSWSYECVTASIDRSLERLHTDRLDLIQLHSCPVETLEKGDAIRAIQDARASGKVRYIGYSGDNDAILWAARSGVFDTLQTSFNLADQGARYDLLAEVRQRGLGLIAKRPILNGAWRTSKDPDPYGNGYASEYFRRQTELCKGVDRFPGEPDDRIAASLGFTLSHPEVTTAIVGSRNPDHVRSNIAIVESLPVEQQFLDAVHKRFDELGSEWPQLT